MYGGYQAAYNAYPAANSTHPYQQYQQPAQAQQQQYVQPQTAQVQQPQQLHYAQPQVQQQQQQQQQQYYGVNPYSNYGYGAVPVPPPPPPTATEEYVQATYRTFPAASKKLPPPGKFNPKPKPVGTATAAAGVYTTGNSYEAAVFKYATQQKPWNAGQRSYGRGQGNADSKQYYCEVCKVSCAGQITYKEHLEGQRHKKKEQAAKTGVPLASLAKNKLSYRCELCGVTCTGQDTYQAHVRGTKHVKTVALHKKLGKPVPEDVPTIIAPGEDGPVETKAKPQWHQQQLPGGKKVIGINTVNFVGGAKLSSTGQLEEKKKQVAAAVGGVGKTAIIEVEDERLKAMMEAEKVDPIGEDQVTEERDPTGKLISFNCKICDCKFSDPHAKDIHVRGRRHRQSYKNKIDPHFVVDPHQLKRKSDKSKNGQQDKSASNGGDASFHRGPWFAQPTIEGRELNIIDERAVEQKYRSMNPGQEFCEKLDKLTIDIHNSLKIVCDKVERTKLGLAEDAPIPNDPEKPKTILGVARIGTISANVYIKDEPFVEMVVSVTPIPNRSLVEQIKNLFNGTNPELAITDDSFSPVCLLVTASYFPQLPCRLYITSTALRTVEAVTSDCPDTETCFKALAYLRHCKWYDNHCQFLNSCSQVVRILRDARSRYPSWSALDDYKTEVLVSNIIDSSPMSLNPAEALKRVLEAISSGFLYSAILVDPCEALKPNVLNSLTEEQKHALTSCAQNMLRLIGFNQIYETLFKLFAVYLCTPRTAFPTELL
uniref:DZF domain-containing protein n=1 Tax=Caenorhabditis japonica TaxID=281687 RepID=A0A8R1DMI1_CAEJA